MCMHNTVVRTGSDIRSVFIARSFLNNALTKHRVLWRGPLTQQ